MNLEMEVDEQTLDDISVFLLFLMSKEVENLSIMCRKRAIC